MNVNNARENLIRALFSTEKRRSSKHACGFTLIELLIVLAIVAVLLTVASPNFDSIISGSKVDETRLGLATSLALARTEAIKRGETIRICAGTPGDCSATDWSAGWEVLRPDDEVLQVVQHDGADADVIGCRPSVAYTSNGALESGPCTFTISRNSSSKALAINATGRVRMN